MRAQDFEINEIYINHIYDQIGLEQCIEKDGKLWLKTIKNISNYDWPVGSCTDIADIDYVCRKLTPMEKVKYL